MENLQRLYRGKRVFITGGLGFIGSSLAHALTSLEAHVTLYDNSLPGSSANRINVRGIQKKIRIIEGDTRDKKKLSRALKHQEIIFNLAGLSSHIKSNKEPFADLDVNCRGQLILLNAIVDICPSAKVVFAGSRAQYGAPKNLPATEDTPMEPVDIYGVHKLLGEYYHFLFQKHYGLRVTCLRKTNTYGPRHQMRHTDFGVQNYFIRLALDHQPITVYDGGRQRRDYTYIDDVVRAYLLCGIRKKADGKVYVLGSGEPIRLIDYAKKVIEIAGSGSIKHTRFPHERKVIEIGDYFADFGLITRELGWRPQVKLDEGLRRTIAFYRKHRQDYW